MGLGLTCSAVGGVGNAGDQELDLLTGLLLRHRD